jgi:hypothetical protein
MFKCPPNETMCKKCQRCFTNNNIKKHYEKCSKENEYQGMANLVKAVALLEEQQQQPHNFSKFLSKKSNTKKSNTKKSNTKKSNTKKSNTKKSNTKKL